MSGRWPEPPHFTECYQLRDRVRSPYTGAEGKVVVVHPGRRLLVEWQDPVRGRYEAWCSVGGDIERVEP